MAARRKPVQDVKVASRPRPGTNVNLRAFHEMISKRFPKILAELAK